jgi:hypothetical protein
MYRENEKVFRKNIIHSPRDYCIRRPAQMSQAEHLIIFAIFLLHPSGVKKCRNDLYFDVWGFGLGHFKRIPSSSK